MDNFNFEDSKRTLRRLIEESEATFSADDVLCIFQQGKEKTTNKKLMKILKMIAKNEKKATHALAETAILLEQKDALTCLLHFLSFFGEGNKPKSVNNNFENMSPIIAPTSTLFSPSPVREIKERVIQAANTGLSKSARSSLSLNSTLISVDSHFSESPKSHITGALPKKDTVWNTNLAELNPFNQVFHRRALVDQEHHLIGELICCLMGMPGCDILMQDDDTNQFVISENIKMYLRNLASEILPLASYYTNIQNFLTVTKTTDCGQVTQALASHIRKLLKEYHTLLIQLERQYDTGCLNLYKMVYYCRPAMQTLQTINDIILEILEKQLRGSGVLTLLANKINSFNGDNTQQELLVQLTQMSAVPYMNILQLWIQKGVIDDPQKEFLVEDNEDIRIEKIQEHYSANYWEKRYTTRKERTPCFLEGYEGVILRTGKYLNVIRQCGKNVSAPKTVPFKFSPIEKNHISFIQNANRFASKTLLEVLIKENDLMGHLSSVRRYFLMQQGDFITQFMDACEEELSKNLDKVLPIRLETLLGLTLRTSSAKHDPYKDDLHCDLLTYDLVTQMSKIINEEENSQMLEFHDLRGLECFAFRYDVKWPVSLVLNHIAISEYQMLFRQLFYFKHVERQLGIVWMGNCIAKKFSPEAAKLYRPAFALRQRMMNAIQNVQHYMMIEVIEPNWHVFLAKMENVENVDDVLNVHEDFLNLCLKNCMLTDTSLLQNLVKLCNTCLKFCEFMQKVQRHFSDAELSSMLCESDEGCNSESELDLSSCKQSETVLAPTETFSQRVSQIDTEFTGLLMKVLSEISEVATFNPSDRFMNLVHRINFNSFYSEHLQNS